MALTDYVYPRFAVNITSMGSGHEIPIDRLRATCLWYPGRADLEVSGHVLYLASSLCEALTASLEQVEEVAVEGGEPDIAHRLAQPVAANRFSTVEELIEAIWKRIQQALPPAKRRQIAALPAQDGKLLQHIEATLLAQGVHVLVPLSIGRAYQLVTDATEALLPVSPNVLRRNPRLCFVVLATDVLEDRGRESPWLRQVDQLMALPVDARRHHPQVVNFLQKVPSLATQDPQLLWELARALHAAAGGWLDLCDRFYARLLKHRDTDELRRFLRELHQHLRQAEADPAHGERLLHFALGGGVPELPQTPFGGEGGSGGFQVVQDVLLHIIERPGEFTWEDHGRAYLDGLVSWDRGLAAVRSKVIELALRGRLKRGLAVVVPEPDPGAAAAPAPGVHTVRWLHVSDFHFTAQPGSDSDIVLEALLGTLEEFRRHGRAVDLVFLTGDLAFSGDPAQYARAEEYLARLCQVLGLDRLAVHLVPGNHDVQRAAGQGLLRTLTDPKEALRYFEPAARRYHLDKFEAFRQFYDRFYGGRRQAAPGQATALSETVHVRDVTLGVLPLNSAWFAQDDEDCGKLLVGEPAVRAGLQAVAAADVKVALLHHPFSDLADVERSLVQQRLLGGCHFILRGHLHETEMAAINTADQQALVMAAGASYQGRTPYQNRALLVEVEVKKGQQLLEVRPYPIRYERTGHDRWTLDTSVFPRSYPTYLETLTLPWKRK